jgi:Fic family protein
VQYDDFIGSPSGVLVPTDHGQRAFVPHRLPPPNIDLQKLIKPWSEALDAIGELNGIGRTIANPYLLIRPLQRREVVSSSSMEGTYTTVDELLVAEANDTSSTTPDTREVLNYMNALTTAIDSLASVPLSLRTIRDSHQAMLRNVGRSRGANVRPGEFKQFQNFIGGAGKIENARFIPPPPRECMTCLQDLERYIHEDENDLDTLINSALIHYQFETIHPFADGNGRVGRMLIILHLFMKKKLVQPLLYLSPILEERKDEYIDRMYAVSSKREYRARLQKTRLSANLLTVVDSLFEHPVISIPAIQTNLNVTYPAAKKNVDILVRNGILSEIEGSTNPRLFAARDIIDLISGKPSNARSSA